MTPYEIGQKIAAAEAAKKDKKKDKKKQPSTFDFNDLYSPPSHIRQFVNILILKSLLKSQQQPLEVKAPPKPLKIVK